jgi:cell division septum initiation protein DivIVA
MAESQQRLDEAAALADRTHTEAEETRSHAARDASRLVEDARQEAAQIIGDARATADRVRADSDRELTAATQRRDSINAQLSNVRQMLATLTGTAAMPLTAFGADEDEPAAGTAEDDASDEADHAEPEGEGEAVEGDAVEGEAADSDRDESLAESKG